MCAHKVIGMSVIALTCSAVVASTLVHTGPETKVISAVFGETSASNPAPCGLHTYGPRTSADDRRRHVLILGNRGVSGSIYFAILTRVAAENVTDAADPAGPDRDRVYAIVEIDDEHFDVESFSPGTETEARRVDASFGPHDL